MKFSIFPLLFFLFLLNFSCSKSQHQPQHQTVIKGNIPNLPDGTMYLDEIEINNIDSAKTVDGKFTIIHKWDGSEPKWIRINHVDKNGIKRLFSFTTNAKYRNVAGWGTNVFYSDSLIIINGNFKEEPPIPGYNLPKNIKEVRGPKLVTGKQTEAYYNIDGDLFEEIDDKTIQTVNEKLKIYPTSYHLLYMIIQNKNDFSAQQVQEFLKSFKGEITNSESYKKLYTYNQKRFNSKTTALVPIEDISGKKSEILDKKFDKHLIIFWASWCGPCRAEIPLLKKIYSSKSPNTEFISISIDDDKNAWKKATNEEKMPWKQFILDKKTPAYENYQIQLKLNSAIPYTVLVDNNFKILGNSTGLGTEEELKKLLDTK